MVIYLMPSEGIDVSPPMSVEEAKLKMVPQYLDVPKTRERSLAGFGTTLAEARTLASYVSLTGVVYPLSSVMADLPEERARLVKMTMPTMPVMPVDLYSRGSDMSWDKFKNTTPDTYIHNYPEILDLKVNTVSGIYTDSITVEIEPHDTRVLQVHALQDHPQVIGNSRHISGAFSILGLSWDDTKNILSGLSETVLGDTYSLFINVPDGFRIEQVRVVTDKNKVVQAESEQTGNLLKLSFQGQAEKVDWQVNFRQSERLRTGDLLHSQMACFL